MKSYKYDYDKDSFKIEFLIENKKKYFIKIKNKYIEVNENIYKTCKSSYDKIRHTYKQEVAKSVIYYEDIDSATFFVGENNNIVEQIHTKELANLVLYEISLLPEIDRKIAECIFVNELTERETAKLLNIPKSTISYKKNRIRKLLIKKMKNYLGK